MKERLALIFLVLLRLAIGWHFLFEAIEKQRSVAIGPSEISRPWTSEPYFREAQGPAAIAMRWKLGDVDEEALARLTVRGGAEGKIPEPLEREWDDYAQRFAEHYGLDSAQREQLATRLQNQKEKTYVWFTARVPSVPWLLAGLWDDFERKPFKRAYPSGTIDVNLTVSERVEEYRAKLREYRTLLHDKPEAIGKDAEKARRAVARASLSSLRTELLALVEGRTAAMKDSLAELLTPEQCSLGTVPIPAGGTSFIWFVDWATRWGLLLIGVGLLLGLFTRTSAWAGALFLLMTVLTTPALPWLPEPPNAEGHYVFISKNVIEMLALFMLAFIPSGRWFGVDALIHAMKPRRKKEIV